MTSMDLSHYVCTKCSADIYLGDEGWGCDCYVIPVRYLEAGAMDLPDFWIETEGTEENA